MDYYAMNQEVETIHNPFKAWLNARWIPFRYDRPDKKTRTTKGEPDFLITWMGRSLHIECKIPGGKLSPDQEARIAFIRRSGNPVEVCHSVEECKEVTRSILCEKRPIEHRNPRTGHLDAVGENCCKIGMQTK